MKNSSIFGCKFSQDIDSVNYQLDNEYC